MKLFILAAGKGERLMPLTKNTPKSLLGLGDGSTLLERQITNAAESGYFTEIVILTGYKHEQIEAKIKEYQKLIKISTIYNPFFNTSNNLVSLWLANPYMLEGDFVITNGDNVYKNYVYRTLIENTPDESVHIAVDFKDVYDDDDMKVTLSQDRKKIVKVHKQIPLADTHAESVGLAYIRGEKTRRLFAERLIEMVKDEANMNVYWLVLFNALSDNGMPIGIKEIDPNDWREMDFHPDIEVLRKLIFSDFF